MDLVDISAATSTRDHKRCVQKNRSWHRRLQLRKAAVRPPAMQSSDKNGAKQIAEEEWEQSAVWLPAKKPPQEDGGSALRFPCPQCKDVSKEYAPKDLVRHFREKHGESPPSFSCHMCTFSTHEFSFLQVHLLSHKDTFSSCSLCNDNVQRTWPEFSAHLTMCHCPGGKYSCETCRKFSTGDFRVFLEHIYGHNLKLEDAGDKQDGKTLTRQFCSFEASEKQSIAKRVKADHVCLNGNRRKRRVHSIAVKPNDTSPGKKTRTTRSSVRETCWLPQDCLSLPGREFLDKYCHLSDPQTTLQETQQFLMETVAAETDDQKWTKALKTVLSNVPPDMSLYQTEDGIDRSDLAVLTVKNKITVAQNYTKRLKTSADKKAVCSESAADDQNERESNRKDQSQHLRVENKLQNGISASEPPPCAGTQENRENQKVKTDRETNPEGSMFADGVRISGDSKDVGLEKTSDHRVLLRSKKQKRRRRRKSRFKKVNKKALKIVFKKNPVKEKQWFSQSSLSPEELSNPRTALETIETLKNAVDHRTGSTPDPHDSPETRTSIHQSEPGTGSSLYSFVEPPGPEDTTGTKPAALEGSSSTRQEVLDDSKKSDLSLEAEVDECRSADGTIRTNQSVASGSGEDVSCEPLQNSKTGSSCQLTEAAVIPQPVPPRGQPDSCTEVSTEPSEQLVEGVKDGDVPADVLSRIQVPSGTSSPGHRVQVQPAPKHRERTLKLVAINSSQLVKRPARDQPVVVLNHPDADIPQVARIMEVVSRHREVQKVILSRRTLRALSALNGEASDPTDNAAWRAQSSVQERFTLKLKLRRLSRKKYEIVGSVSPGQVSASKFPCWFCGRIFGREDAMMVHRQRHLMEWKKPNCEVVNVKHTG
ncbi:uncharacterized protein LOC108247176 [Kryptolebias marmoratus]|uniref:uncharacterized protein LOC108247176 n=1 Tax=Kryptolebias marmoratus TaxID=37003 RepID=UPI0007F8EB0E|nr:uncharacterized protein LOC108247176 [Kryptolebias marmoratus]XP_024866080.1 uncharacterized protein LOC108247176 [Kryptolebias marmoratus]